MANHHSKILVLGSGAAGCTAAIYTARGNLQPTLVHGMQPGGQMTITTEVENYPGFAEVIQGPWLMEQMEKQAEHVGTKMVHDTITEVDFSKRPFTLKGDSGDSYSADAVILGTGASAKWLGLESEKNYQGYGVSGCATCDGAFFRNVPVAVVGGGNTAVEEALYLTNHASKVYVVHRRDELRAEKVTQERLFKHPKVEMVWDSELQEVEGKDDPKAVTGARVKNVKTGEERTLEVEGVFIAIGHKPNTDIFKGTLKMDDEGYIVTEKGTTKTSVEGVFAAGDVQDKIYRQAITAAGSGCMAALDAMRWLESQD